MQYSAESIHFLWIAYAAMIAGNVGYSIWLAVRWSRTKTDR